MSNFVRKHASVVMVAMMTALVTASVAPAIAHGNTHAKTAHNADTVDKLHAVKAAAPKSKRKGKLVATHPLTGFLPNNIIQKASDANKLDGKDSTAFSPASHTHNASDINDGAGSGLDADLLDGESSDDFVEQAGTGTILVQGDVSNWKHAVGSGSLTASPGVAQTSFTSTSSMGSAQMFLVPDLALAAYGKRLRMEGVEICYDASPTHILDTITYNRTSNDAGVPSVSGQVLDTADYTDEACRYYQLVDPGLFSDSTVSVSVNSIWFDMGALLRLQRVTFMLEPTATDATPLS